MKIFVSFVWPLVIIAIVGTVLASSAEASCRKPLRNGVKALVKFVLPGR